MKISNLQPVAPGLAAQLFKAYSTANALRPNDYDLTMMREADAANAGCWTFCEVIIGDVSDAGFLELFSGGDDEKPEGMTGEVRIRVGNAKRRNTASG
jgi:hypothetical protein